LAGILEVVDLHKRFPMKKGLSVHAVNGVNFSIAAGETLGLVGESGCGKTTVGRCAVRLIEPTSGEIVLMGKDVTRLNSKDFRKYRNKVQIVFQEPYDALNPRKVVKQILEDPLTIEGRLEAGERLKRVKEILEMVELTDDCLGKYPVQLTQGEQQRIGVARALATNPQVIILDEPTSLLDIHFRAEVVLLLKRLQEELGVAYLFISHDLVVIGQLSYRIAVMYLGRIVEEGPAKAVFESPMHPYTQALLAASLLPDPDQKRGELMLKGEVPSPVNLPDNRCNLAPRCPLAKSYCYESLPELKEVAEGHFVACFRVHR
jgi:oligopeptide transport system ATP-binding protein